MKWFVGNLFVLMLCCQLFVNGQDNRYVKDSILLGIEIQKMSNEKYVQFVDSLKRNGISLLQGTEFGGEVLPVMQLNTITILPSPKFANQTQIDRYSKLVRMVKEVYPYSQIIKKTYTELQANLLTIKNEKERNIYLKKAEKELRDKFESQLVKMPVPHGKILIKLVDRELGITTYEVIKELKGSFLAYFYQSFARVFGHNLKSIYDKTGEDAMIEDIIIRIEKGQL